MSLIITIALPIIFLIVAGVPALVKQIRIKKRLEVHLIARGGRLPVADFFNDVEEKAAQIGFTKVADFQVEGLSSKNYNRIFRGPGETCLLASIHSSKNVTHRVIELVRISRRRR